MEESSQSEKYSSTGIYVLVSGLLAAIAAACFYFLEKPLPGFGLAAIPLLLILTSKNTVIELLDQHFLIKNYFLLGVKKRKYTYHSIVFVHYHRHSYFFLLGFDFWGFYRSKPVEVRFNNTQFETLSVYGASATILKGIQAVNDRIQKREGQLHEENSNKVS